MTNTTWLQEDVPQLLQEAGCPDEFTQRFLAAMETESVTNQLQLLRSQRSCQLVRLHEEEKKLDCLDFLRYKLEKQLPADKKSRRA